MQETWKDVVGYEGLYKISNLGNVTSKTFNFSRPMVVNPSKDGYVRVLLYKDHKYKACYVHILVATAFIPRENHQSEVNHIDGNKSNNCVSNLEWCTRSQNSIHAFKLNLRTNPMLNKFGAENHRSKKLYQYDMQGNLIKVWDSRSEAANYYHCSVGSICNCVYHRKKSCKGYRWENEPLTIKS